MSAHYRPMRKPRGVYVQYIRRPDGIHAIYSVDERLLNDQRAIGQAIRAFLASKGVRQFVEGINA
jgi:hypothetical protein